MSLRPQLDSLLSPEARTLLCVASPAPGPAGNDPLLEAIRHPDLDWPRLALLAELERATPILWRRLQALPDDAVPDTIAHRFRQLARVSSFRLGFLEERFLQSIDALQEAGIQPVLLKGAALAATCYDGFAERPMLDADILVSQSDASRAWQLLVERGWTAEHSSREAELYASHHHLPPLVDKATDTAFEIHTRLAPGFDATDLAPDAVRAAARPARLAGREVLVPDTQHLLLHHAIHFAWSHGLSWAGWRTFRDTHAITHRLDTDWDRLVDSARSARATTCVYWTLRLADALTTLDVHDHILRRLRPPRPEAVLRILERHFITTAFAPGDRGCPSTTLSRHLWSAGIAPRWSGHGDARPWDHDADWIESRTGSPAAPLRDRIRNQLRHLGHWSRYASTVLGLR